MSIEPISLSLVSLAVYLCVRWWRIKLVTKVRDKHTCVTPGKPRVKSYSCSFAPSSALINVTPPLHHPPRTTNSADCCCTPRIISCRPVSGRIFFQGFSQLGSKRQLWCPSRLALSVVVWNKLFSTIERWRSVGEVLDRERFLMLILCYWCCWKILLFFQRYDKIMSILIKYTYFEISTICRSKFKLKPSTLYLWK